MDGIFIRQFGLAVALLFGLAGTVAAQQATPTQDGVQPEGYVTDNYGNTVTDVTGDCVTSNAWQPQDATAECDPELVTQEAAPFAAVEQPRRVTRLINLEADTTFGFDEAQLTDQGRQKLDEIVDAMRGTQDPRVRITGHADWIGPESYNLALSRDRAQAVRDYLVQQGVPEQSIQIAARGEGSPVVSCEGLQGDALVECLRPNRRSEIEFSAFEVVTEDGTQPQQQQNPTGRPNGEVNQQLRENGKPTLNPGLDQ